MGQQMKQILQVLANLKNPEEGYHEATWGVTQTEIIIRVLNLKPYTEKRFMNRESWVKSKDEAKKLILELKRKGKKVEVTERGNRLLIISYDYAYNREPIQMRVASALLGKKVGQSASPYNFMGRVQAVNLALKNPEMRNDPVVKRHFDWVEEYWSGKKQADKIYASFSRSLKLLLGHGLITSTWHYKETGEQIRHHRARYLLSEAGKGRILQS